MAQIGKFIPEWMQNGLCQRCILIYILFLSTRLLGLPSIRGYSKTAVTSCTKMKETRFYHCRGKYVLPVVRSSSVFPHELLMCWSWQLYTFRVSPTVLWREIGGHWIHFQQICLQTLHLRGINHTGFYWHKNFYSRYKFLSSCYQLCKLIIYYPLSKVSISYLIFPNNVSL